MDFSELTEEEKVIVRDCQRKNFWGRALPLSLGAMAGCQVLAARGIINKSWIKTFGFGVAGYIFGRISLPSQIKERLLKEAPEGAIARATREMQNMSLEEKREFLANLRNKGPPVPSQWEGAKGTGPMGSGLSSDNYPRVPQDAVDVRLKPTSENYDSHKQIGVETPAEVTTSYTPPRLSYAEQRKLHSQHATSGEFSADITKPRSVEDFQESEPSSTRNNRKAKKNVYGDEME